ncbi:BBSome complex member BBS2-like isoform X2 [Dermacentor albipictus]|uniref:BBSome complex member BBS2-like isoform X2 n=1 Tax=Dermacentor albipictus TaxID=60249 RepID=UPI0038FC7E01
MSCSKGRDNLVPQFTFHLNHKVLARRVTVGKYDGLHPCITAATASDKVLVHNNNRQQRSGDRWEGGGDVSLLNVNQTVSCVAAGCLKPGAKEDVLLVGTPTALLAYDVENNCDLFFREVADGAHSVATGYLGSRRNPVVLVGGNCSIQGFDHDGEDVFWTVTGDNVRALALYDFNKDGLNELLVGSEDFDIRVFRDDVIVAEIAENEAVTALCPLTHECFAYALANGTIGVYRATERLWRIKSKSQAVCLHGYDIDGDGRPELITGWSNGKVDARSLSTGEVVFRDSLAHGVAGIVQADYCLDGREQLIVVSGAGEVRGYLAASAELRQQAADATFEQDTVRELSHKKQTLLQELRNYETSADAGQCGSIPANTQLKTLLAINSGSGGIPPHVEVALETNNETVIRAVILFAEGIFDGESLVCHPKAEQVQREVSLPLWPPRDLAVDLHLKVLVGQRDSGHFHVFELSRQLPRFAAYLLLSEKEPRDRASAGSVRFRINDRPHRVASWVNQNFLLPEDLCQAGTSFRVSFVALRCLKPITIDADASGEVSIETDLMDVAADMVQSLAAYLELEHLESRAHFPDEYARLRSLVDKVREHESARLTISANMADTASIVRGLLLRAEDCRLLRDYDGMRRWYQELQTLNRELVSDHRMRCQSHEELSRCVRMLNRGIERAAGLRAGRHKATTVAACRQALAPPADGDALLQALRGS